MLLVTRYEYANLYHTIGDFYNAYLTHMAAGTFSLGNGMVY